ncbi:hypothetical protein WICMUC_004328 [Wickerhamomyces mucosus]|uniref:Sorting nexin MVP1 n=1 Tax=Wickerhamomyces mucosus TaxID=1378264 RepID=A0A9P8PI00_9ASCO|nr:hypothetical protein WICMUC_004328 [Wickerhamomyces mucosus]
MSEIFSGGESTEDLWALPHPKLHSNNDGVTTSINTEWGSKGNESGSRELNSSIWNDDPINKVFITNNEPLSNHGQTHKNNNDHNGNNNNQHVNADFASWVDAIRFEFRPLGQDLINITEIPEREGLLFKHTNYLVEHLVPIFEDDTNSDSSSSKKVIRRYSDFHWLSEILLKKYPFRIIPELPPKSVTYSNKDALFMEKRVKGLKRFVNQIFRHPVLKNDELFIMFLSVPTDLSNWRKQANYNQNEEFLNQSIDDLFLRNWDGVFLERWNELTDPLFKSFELWNNLRILIERFERRLEQFEKDEERFANNILQFTESINHVYSFDNNTNIQEINDNLRIVANHYKEDQKLVQDHRSSLSLNILEDFKKYSDYLNAFQTLFERFKRIGGNQIPQLELKIRQLKDRLSSYNGKPDVKGYEIDKINEEILKLTKTVEYQTNRDWLIKKTVLHEYIIFQETQYQITFILKKLVADNLHFTELHSNNWTKLNDSLQDMPTSRTF